MCSTKHSVYCESCTSGQQESINLQERKSKCRLCFSIFMSPLSRMQHGFCSYLQMHKSNNPLNFSLATLWRPDLNQFLLLFFFCCGDSHLVVDESLHCHVSSRAGNTQQSKIISTQEALNGDNSPQLEISPTCFSPICQCRALVTFSKLQHKLCRSFRERQKEFHLINANYSHWLPL